MNVAQGSTLTKSVVRVWHAASLAILSCHDLFHVMCQKVMLDCDLEKLGGSNYLSIGFRLLSMGSPDEFSGDRNNQDDIFSHLGGAIRVYFNGGPTGGYPLKWGHANVGMGSDFQGQWTLAAVGTNGHIGKYFYFDIAQWQSVFGAAPSFGGSGTPGLEVEVVQTRGGTEIWRGSVIIWNRPAPDQSDFPGVDITWDITNGAVGRRNSESANGQWRVGDVISPITGRPLIKNGVLAFRNGQSACLPAPAWPGMAWHGMARCRAIRAPSSSWC